MQRKKSFSESFNLKNDFIAITVETDIPQKKQTSKKDQSNNKMETDS